MTYFIGKHLGEGEMRVVTRAPRKGGLAVDTVRLTDDYTGQGIPAHKFWQARKWATLEAANKALEAVHYAGFDEYTVMERGDI